MFLCCGLLSSRPSLQYPDGDWLMEKLGHQVVETASQYPFTGVVELAMGPKDTAVLDLAIVVSCGDGYVPSEGVIYGPGLSITNLPVFSRPASLRVGDGRPKAEFRG